MLFFIGLDQLLVNKINRMKDVGIGLINRSKDFSRAKKHHANQLIFKTFKKSFSCLFLPFFRIVFKLIA